MAVAIELSDKLVSDAKLCAKANSRTPSERAILSKEWIATMIATN